jgi:tryptophan-rich sensory protein
MLNLNPITLAIAIGVCVALTVLDGFLVRHALKPWYADLVKPRLQIPIWFFYLVSVGAYIIDAVILYRLVAFAPSFEGQVIAIAALSVVMLFNALRTYTLFRLAQHISRLPGHARLAGGIGRLTIDVVYVRGHVSMAITSVQRMGRRS